MMGNAVGVDEASPPDQNLLQTPLYVSSDTMPTFLAALNAATPAEQNGVMDRILLTASAAEYKLRRVQALHFYQNMCAVGDGETADAAHEFFGLLKTHACPHPGMEGFRVYVF
jgi:hypothetical protein